MDGFLTRYSAGSFWFPLGMDVLMQRGLSNDWNLIAVFLLLMSPKPTKLNLSLGLQHSFFHANFQIVFSQGPTNFVSPC